MMFIGTLALGIIIGFTMGIFLAMMEFRK